MADEKNVQPPRFKVTNVVRRVNTRVRRVLAPGKRRFKQYVCGKRLLRKQSMWISEAELKAHEAALHAMVREGAIEITAPDGSVLGVDTWGNLVSRQGKKVERVDGANTPSAPAPAAEPPKAAPPPPSNPAPQPAPKASAADALIELPGVGAGRARKLEAAGISTFKQLAAKSPAELVKILGTPLTEDQAAEICAAAASRKEG